ncbi:MAG: hypothetical protein M1549_04325 [Candidatus Dependentiae bacterium]|nr:hypothetical protein [Candidatus Dependentiae bacterium]
MRCLLRTALLCVGMLPLGIFAAGWGGYLPLDMKLEISKDKTTTTSPVFTIPIAPDTNQQSKNPFYVSVEISHVDSVCPPGTLPSHCGGKAFKEPDNNIDWFDFKPLNKKVEARGNLEKLHNWQSKDATDKRLFRPYVFYDVMGVTEWTFKGRAPKGKPALNSFPPLGSAGMFTAESVKTAFPGREAFYATPAMEFHADKSVKDYRDASALVGTAVSSGSFTLLNGWELGGFTVAGNAYQINQQKVLEGLKQTDIRYLMETNPGAAFQIASNFNCLEGGMGSYSALLEAMQYAPTQGEETSLATMAASIQRKYVVDENDRNLLRGLRSKLSVDFNGRVTEISSALSDGDADQILIGVHQNAQVTSGYYPPFSKQLTGEQNIDAEAVKERAKFLYDNHFVQPDRDPLMVYNKFIPYDQRHTVDLIFNAALDLNGKHFEKLVKQNKNPPYDVTDSGVIKSAKVILDGMYAGTIYAAAALKKKKLFLTLLGAGAFKNEIDWIIAALRQPSIVEAVRNSGMTVVIVLYPDIRTDRKGSFSPSDTQKFINLVADLNAKIGSTGQTGGGAKGAGADLVNLASALEQLGGPA